MRTFRLSIVLLALLAAVVPTAVARDAYVPDANAARADVPDEFKWSLDQLFADDDAWSAEADRLADRIPELAAFAGRLDDPAALTAALDLYFRLHEELNRVTLYANLRQDTSQGDDATGAMQSRGVGMMNEFMATAGFLRNELLAMDRKSMAGVLEHADGPAAHRGYIENLRRRRARLLGDEAERVLALTGDNLWAEIDLNEIPSALETAFGALLTDIAWPVVHDADGAEVQLTLANYGRFRASDDRAVRREAVAAFMATLRRFEHAFAATLSGQYALDVTYARARGYDTALEAYMDKDGLDTAVYENLIAAVHEHLPSLHRYVELRRRVMDVDAVHLYDLYVPLVEGVEMEVPFAEARRILPEALAPLGERYGERLAEGLDPANGWMDLYPHAGKASGAFSASVYDRHPYVKMNYQDSVDDLSTLAHEFGHALHSDLSMRGQGYGTFRYVPFLAEIASTCNEALLSHWLIDHAENDRTKAALLVERLEGIRTTIFRQTLFAEFERAAHAVVERGDPLNATVLNDLYGGLIRAYYGPDFAMDENDALEWAYIPHFYYKYYVYTYATGLSSGIAIAERILEQGEQAVADYLTMLEGGCAAPPLELLAGAGVDLTRPEAVAAAMELFARTLDELEDLL